MQLYSDAFAFSIRLSPAEKIKNINKTHLMLEPEEPLAWRGFLTLSELAFWEMGGVIRPSPSTAIGIILSRRDFLTIDQNYYLFHMYSEYLMLKLIL